MKTLIVQKVSRDWSPLVIDAKQYFRGDVIDVLPGRKGITEGVMRESRWCAIVVTEGISDTIKLKLLHNHGTVNPSALRRRECFLDLDGLGIDGAEGFVECTRSELAVIGAMRDKPLEKQHWIIGA